MFGRLAQVSLLLSLTVFGSACSGDETPSSEHPGTGGTAAGGTSTGSANSGGSGSAGAGSGGMGGDVGAAGAGGDAAFECRTHQAACELTECDPPLEPALHEAPCAPLTFHSNPPTSGTHYSSWAAFELYDRPVPRGFLLHSLEHSAVVLSYNCEAAAAAGVNCDDLVAELTEFYETWPADPLCTETRHRLILTPDPELDTVFAAAAWGHYVKGACFDAAVVSDFIEANYGQTYENFCNPGVDPFDAIYPANCGQ